jgi:hypothetical protein
MKSETGSEINYMKIQIFGRESNVDEVISSWLKILI